MKLNELFTEADPSTLGSMNDKMKNVLSKVHSGDEKEKQDKIDAENKAKDDTKKAATMYAMKHPEEMEEYVKLLKGHDWTYDYSDDHSVWRRGADAHKKLRQMADKLDPEHEVWNKYDPFAKKESVSVEDTISEQEFSNVVVKGNNTKIPTVAQQLGWKTEPNAMGREFTTILPDSKPLTKDAVDKFIADLGLKFSSGTHAKSPFAAEEETYDGDDFYEEYGVMWFNEDDDLDEAEYQGRKVKLGKPMQGDVKKFKVYVKDPKTGNVKKVNFGDPNMRIKKSNPARRRSFRARHNCDNPGPRTKARYWSCRKW